MTELFLKESKRIKRKSRACPIIAGILGFNFFICSDRGTVKRKREDSDPEMTPAKEPKKKKTGKGEKLPPLDEELVRRMKALVDYIVEYEDT